MVVQAVIDGLLAEAAKRQARAAFLERYPDPDAWVIAYHARASAREQQEVACELMMREWIRVLEARRAG